MNSFDVIKTVRVTEKGTMQGEKFNQYTVVADRRRHTSDGRPVAVIVVTDEANVHAACERRPGAFDEERGGLGLQLPLARRIIEGHGGHLSAPAATTTGGADDPVARGSLIISLPITE